MTVPTLAEQAVQFDTLRFSNTEVERQARATFERDLTNAVRVTEDFVLGQAKAMSKEVSQHRKTADSVTAELAEIAEALARDEPVDLEGWAVLVGQARALASKADGYRARVEALEPRIEDPLAYASSLQERFNGLHRPMLLPAPGTY
jgi:hypothetical protein